MLKTQIGIVHILMQILQQLIIKVKFKNKTVQCVHIPLYRSETLLFNVTIDKLLA